VHPTFDHFRSQLSSIKVVAMESYPLEAVPGAGDIHVACFSAVKNAADLKERLQAQAQDQTQTQTQTLAMVESNLVFRTHLIETAISVWDPLSMIVL